MTVKALMPVRRNLVAPLGHKPTDMHMKDTAAGVRAESSAASHLIGENLRIGSLHSATGTLPTLGIATSTTATRTTTTRATRAWPLPSAESNLFAPLVQAYLDCRRNKRTSTSAQAFEEHVERNLFDLHEELASGEYRPGRSICFVITRPKPREVWAAGFRDRVVHHLLYNHIAPRFHASFVADSCACIPGRGTLYAARRLEHQVRSISRNWSRPTNYLKCDLANFFVSINKTVLLEQLQRRVFEPWWMALAETILMHDPRSNVEVRGSRRELARVPAHKSLFNAPSTHGLPIGNLSSQFFANVLLDDLDQHVKHRIRAPHYVRYVDDFVLLHEDAAWLNWARERIEAKLADLDLRLNPSKTILQPASRGIDFVGHVLKPWRRTTRPRTMTVALRRVAEAAPEDVHQTANSYFGLLRQATHSHHDRAALANVVRRRGHAVSAALTKTYRSKA
ncbi:RNA-directed DNA polymerase [Pandoraea sp. SD6-2]|uniref:RNA-directed DNA polymerase n=1 Tax=Pandoraea sp. SD6-2 TaxID=1286093 RepID=UPI00032F4BDF|nr:reverse transcriptase domain protein [Pandoraea sp. SD6-2]